jgi:histidinol-phosphate aminotransferase
VADSRDPILRHVHPWLRDIETFPIGEPPAGALRLDLNEGPYGPTPSSLEAIRRHAGALNRYPDAESGYGLRSAMASRLGVSQDAVLFGPGSNTLGSLLIRITAGPGDRVAYSWPGFPTYPWAASRVGAVPVPVAVRRDGSDDLDGLLEAARTARLVVLATPANPTGRQVVDGMREFVAEASKTALVVIDEAYHEYGDPAVSGVDLFREGAEVAVLRTFSKAWGLAGARIGYAVMSPALRMVARTAQDTFEVSAIAFHAALAALDDADEVARRVRENAEVRARLMTLLAAHGAPCYDSRANFVCALPPDADGFAARLAELGIIVRVITPFGDPTRVRIGVPALADEDRVHAAIVAALG